MKYRDLLSIVSFGLFSTFVTWIVYRLLLFIMGSVTPFKTLDATIIGFLPLFIAIIFCNIISIIFVNTRSLDRKTNEEITRRFYTDYITMGIEIIFETDKKKKEELRKRRAELRLEYLSLTSANLQRKDGTVTTDWRKSLLATRRRLLDEKDTLKLNNKINLEAAIFMAFVGIALPTYYIFSDNTVNITAGFSVFVANYWPVFSVVVVFEIIAIFFLRLYSQTAHRLERNQNELTNIELRLTAGLMLCDEKNKTKLKPLADELAKEERNFILGKNESSATLDTDKLVEILSKFIPKAGG